MRALLLGVVLAALVTVGHAQTITYLPAKMFLEVQGWWTPAGSSTTMHIHLGGPNTPIRQALSGVVVYDATVKLHFANGTITKLQGSWSPDLTGPLLVGDPLSIVQERTFQQTMDTTKASYDGWFLFTMQAFFDDPNDINRAVRLRGHTQFVNGNPLNTKYPKEITASAWLLTSDFESRGYSSAELNARSVPLTPRAGIWTPLVKVGSSKPGQTRHLFVTVDPNIHAGNLGWVIADVRNVSRTWRTVSIDTTRLANGPHLLMIKASDEGMFPSGTSEGVLVVGFVVAN